MQLRIKLTIIFVASFAIFRRCLAFTSQAKASPGDEAVYLAPLLNDCRDDDPLCGKKEGRFVVHLHKGHKDSHLEFIQRHIHINPVKDWQLEWDDDQTHTVSHVSEDSINHLRQDLGVKEIEQSYWFRPALVDPCRNPRLSENERRSCYVRSEAGESGRSIEREMNEL